MIFTRQYGKGISGNKFQSALPDGSEGRFFGESRIFVGTSDTDKIFRTIEDQCINEQRKEKKTFHEYTPVAEQISVFSYNTPVRQILQAKNLMKEVISKVIFAIQWRKEFAPSRKCRVPA